MIYSSQEINRAGFLLTDTNMTVANVGLQVSYDNMEHFIRSFRRVHGMTPRPIGAKMQNYDTRRIHYEKNF